MDIAVSVSSEDIKMISDVYKDKNLLKISPLYAIAILRFLNIPVNCLFYNMNVSTDYQQW